MYILETFQLHYLIIYFRISIHLICKDKNLQDKIWVDGVSKFIN